MAATAAQIARLRLMTDEPTTTPYSDAVLAGIIERYALPDDFGVEPLWLDVSTTPPTPTVRDSWIPTYDINAAAAEVWDYKAAAVAEDFNYEADNARFDRAQVVDQYNAQAAKYRQRRSPRAIKLTTGPVVPMTLNVANAIVVDGDE